MALVGDDCFFFLNSGCVRGGQCTFRHQPAARDAAITCPQWLQRSCFNQNCTLRHNDDLIARDRTPCYFEANHGGCLKPNCPFLHLRKNVVLPASAANPVRPAHAINLSLGEHSPVINNAPMVIEKEIITPNHGITVNNGTGNIPHVNAIPHAANAMGSNPVILGQLPSVKVPNVYVPNKPQLPMVPAVEEQIQRPQSMALPPLKNISLFGSVAANAYPKSEHFNEQVRLFKELLASKSIAGQKKHKDNESHGVEDGKNGGIHKVKERQRMKKDKKEKDVYKTHKSKTSKDGWSKADEEILYGDYKDIPIDKKHKKKKHRQQNEDSDTEIKVKSYEQILREKALRKLFSKRKEKEEKFNEDFEELLVSNEPSKKRNKKYSSDGDDREYFNDSPTGDERLRKRASKKERSKQLNPLKHNNPYKKNSDDDFDSFSSESNDSQYVNTSGEDEQSNVRDSKIIPKLSGDRGEKLITHKITEKVEIDKIKSDKLCMGKVTNKKEKNQLDRKYSSESECGDTQTADKIKEMSSEEIFADETTSIDFTVDHDDDLAMEINQNEINENSSRPKISSVVNIIKKDLVDGDLSGTKNNYHGKSLEIKNTVSKSAKCKQKSQSYKSKNNERVRRRESPLDLSNIKDTTSRPVKSKKSLPSDLKTSDKDRRRKSPIDVSDSRSTKSSQANKVVKLISTSEKNDEITDSSAPSKISGETENLKKNVSIKSSVVKVKSFDEIMEEKRKRKYETIVTTVGDSPCVSKCSNSTLQEKSVKAKLEVLDAKNDIHVATRASINMDQVKDATVEKSMSNIGKFSSNGEKVKRKPIQLYQPPQNSKVENEVIEKAEVKTVVNTGPRKIIRVRKASLSTDLIDKVSSVNESCDTTTIEPKKDVVKVRPFEEIIREKRLRQKREKELNQQTKEENKPKKEIPVTSNSNNLVRRKPVLRRPIQVSSCHLSTTSTRGTCIMTTSLANIESQNRPHYSNNVSESSIITSDLITVCSSSSSSCDFSHRPISASTESQRTHNIETNVAKVSPLQIVSRKRRLSESKKKVDSQKGTSVKHSEALENKDFFSKLRSFSSTKRGSISSHNIIQKNNKLAPSVGKTRKGVEESLSSARITSQKIIPFSFSSSNLLNGSSHASQEDSMEPSRRDIQEALDEQKRKREQDLLSDDEFEKEINELCTSDSGDDGEFEDINEDDLLMELEQMIDG